MIDWYKKLFKKSRHASQDIKIHMKVQRINQDDAKLLNVTDVKTELERKYGHFWYAWTEHPLGEYQLIDIQWMDGPAKEKIKSELLSFLQAGHKIAPQLTRNQSLKSQNSFGNTSSGFDKWRTTSLPIIHGKELFEELKKRGLIKHE